MARLHCFTATILATQSLSDTVVVDLIDPDLEIVAIQMPAGWDAANLTFRAAADDALADLYDGGTEVVVTAAAARYLSNLPEGVRKAVRLAIRSGTAALPVNQTANRLLRVLARVRPSV